MAKDLWQYRFRAHFARNPDECEAALVEAALALCATTAPERCARLTTSAGNRKTKSDFSRDALAGAIKTHIGGPRWLYHETVIDDGQSRDRQAFRLQLLTWNIWDGKGRPLKTDDYRTPSLFQCFWDAGDASHVPTAGQLIGVLELLASPARLFYSWADICLCPAKSLGLSPDRRQSKGIDPVRPHADIYDGDDIDYRDIVRGAFWFNCLGPGHIARLGGIKQVVKNVAAFSPHVVDTEHVILSLRASPSLETTDDVFESHARLAAYLKDLYPPSNVRATWRNKFHEKLKDGRVLTNIMWLRRFIDEGFLSDRVFQLRCESEEVAHE